MVKIGIVGVGVVGQSVAQILKDNQEVIKARSGEEIVVKSGVVRNLNKKRDIDIKLSDNYLDITQDSEIDIVVELMGGLDEAYEVVKSAIKNNKAVVSANKALLAYHRFELEKMTNKPFEYEASVAGGIPIIKALKEGLSANNIKSIRGIINGTCNYMLSEMKNGANYDEVLKTAQELGYAEADPTFDVGGFDAGHKLLILASIAYNVDAKPDEILIEGIEEISSIDMEFAKEFGYEIKLLGIAKQDGEFVELRVHPAMIKNTQMLSKVEGVMNAVSVIGDKVGETLYYGAGAGGDATASAVVADIISIVRGNQTPMLGYKQSIKNSLKLKNKNDIQSKYYLRIAVEDEVGVLEKITSILAKHNISINNFLQTQGKDFVKVLLSTHNAIEKDIQASIKEIEKLEFVKKGVVLIRMEE